MSHKPNNPKDKKEAPQQEEAVLDDVQEAFDEQNSIEDEENDLINKQLSDIDALNKQLQDAEDKLAKEKKEYLFLMAEFDNFRKRTVKENQNSSRMRLKMSSRVFCLLLMISNVVSKQAPKAMIPHLYVRAWN